ncbi:MarR family transcriptional regulator [Helicobacter sp. MIT 21-1697]|uniref:MarR family winged helix-turn-helix transcriptional regulator n=1 Tax=Helicobacter sp. MIT 21-1697 TaxID=2993733 RepID=UPI00224B3934|nr:MarR family transcriptional regulator [Helicobacter sp. MIT 21-1697]MCX2716279.1 MarR family transcriptional regulator [Helicobacter sp. MIT 21-1697]
MSTQHFIGHQVGETARCLQAFFINELKTYQLSFEQGVILILISENPHTCISKIAKVLNKNKATISREVNSLVKKEFCIKNQTSHNQRTLSLALTPSGKSAVSYLKEKMKKTEEFLHAQCTQEEIDICFDVLHRIRLTLQSSLKKYKLTGGGAETTST